MSKYPIELIKADFVQKRMTFEELVTKYGISSSTLSYHSRKSDWHKKRKTFRKQIESGVATKRINKAVEGEITLIERFEKLLKLKLDAEMKVFLDTADIPTKKELMYLVNKSKDSTTEIAKLLELLKGNATERTDQVKPEEKSKRFSRLKEFMTVN